MTVLVAVCGATLFFLELHVGHALGPALGGGADRPEAIRGRWIAASNFGALMASDGFHPGPGVYAPWRKQLAELLFSRLSVAKSSHDSPTSGALEDPGN